MTSNFCVYKHTSPNGKVYIGITSQNPKERWFNGKGYNRQRLFYRAIQKYGWDNFTHEILFEGLSKGDACQKEIELIANYKSNNPEFGYNLTNGGEGVIGYRPSLETIQKLRVASMGNQYGKGYKHTEEAKEKIRQAVKGRKKSAESIEKWRKSRQGFHHSEETKQKISKLKQGNTNMLGKHHSETTKKRLAEVARNRIFSEETREKLRQSALNQWKRYYKMKEEENKDVKV